MERGSLLITLVLFGLLIALFLAFREAFGLWGHGAPEVKPAAAPPAPPSPPPALTDAPPPPPPQEPPLSPQ